MQQLIDKIHRQKQLSLYRTCKPLLKKQGVQWKYKNHWFLSFMNNNYLGLATHPKIIQSLQRGANRYGVGSGASQLLGGYYAIHQKLEESLCEFTGFERTLIFTNGFMANLAVLTTLIHYNDNVFADRGNHASLIDGCRYGKIKMCRYRRDDIPTLEQRIGNTNAKNKWIITEGVFSMDGEVAPIPRLLDLGERYNCQLILDDAHGMGVLGKNGRGCLEYYQLPARNIGVLIGTFGKAFGTMGAFVAANNLLIEALTQFGRSYIYTTALAPAIVSATYTSLKLIQEESWRRDHLNFLIQYFKKQAKHLQLPILPSITPIQTMVVENTKKALKIDALLKQKGILVGCIRPPTVPPNTARLRMNLTAEHTKQHINFLLENLHTIWHKQLEH